MPEITWVGKALAIHLSREGHDFCLGVAGVTFRLIGQHLRIYGVALNVVRPCALRTGKTFHYILNVNAGVCFHTEKHKHHLNDKWHAVSVRLMGDSGLDFVIIALKGPESLFIIIVPTYFCHANAVRQQNLSICLPSGSSCNLVASSLVMLVLSRKYNIY